MPASESSQKRESEQGAALIVALLVIVLLFLLGIAILTISDLENGIAANDIWEDGAFNAAEAGIQTGINQLGPDPATCVTAVPVTSLTTSYSFRSGRIADGSAQPLQYVGATTASGYDLNSGTGYNEAGFVHHVYQITATGSGPKNSQREVEVQVTYGPVPR